MYKQIRMIVIISSPVVGFSEQEEPLPHLDLWNEWRRITESLRTDYPESSEPKDTHWLVERLLPPTLEHLANVLAEGNIDIVHFIGHASQNGLFLEDEYGRTHLARNEYIIDLFKRNPVKLIVLNACHTSLLAYRLYTEAKVEAVIGMSDKLRDDEAIIFSKRFFAWLRRGRSAEEAFQAGISSLKQYYSSQKLGIPFFQDQESYLKNRVNIFKLYGNTRFEIGKKVYTTFIFHRTPILGVPLGLIEGFVGRGYELVQISQWIEEHKSPFIVISGLGGIGKSALATMAVTRNSWRFQKVISLSCRQNPSLLPEDIILTLEEINSRFREAPYNIKINRIVNMFNNSSILLFLDNVEDLSEKSIKKWIDFFQKIDPRSPSVVLITTRVFHNLLRNLSPYHLRLTSLKKEDAMRLASNRITLQRLWHKVPSRKAILQLVQKTGAHPYLIRLSIGDLTYPHMTWEKLLQNIEKLKGKTWEERTTEMVGKMIMRLRQKIPGAFQLLLALSVFRGGASFEALQEVAGYEDIDENLARLLDLSLVEFYPRKLRYDLHSLVSSFLSKHFSVEQIIYRERYMEYFRKYLESHRNNYDALERELPNLTEAFRLICGATDDSNLVYKLWNNWFFILRGHWKEYDLWTKMARDAVKRIGDSFIEAQILVDWGTLKVEQDQLNTAKDLLARGRLILEKYGEKGDPERLCRAIYYQGVIAYRQRNFDLALKFAKESLALCRQWGLPGLIASNLSLLAQIKSKQGKVEEARRFFKEAEDILRKTDDKGRLASLLLSVGISEKKWGNLEKAKGILKNALNLALERGMPHIEAGCRYRLAEIEYELGNFREAMIFAQKALSIYKKLGMDETVHRTEKLIHNIRKLTE